MKVRLTPLIVEVVETLFSLHISAELTQPEPRFGDAATNVAMQLAKRLGRPPREVAEEIAHELRKQPDVQEVSVAGPGFINIRLTDAALAKELATPAEKLLQNQEILVEFGDPNPFKAMHLGHLYTTVAGDAIAGLLESAGATVRRLSYHGDVGMHVAKAIWAVRADQQKHPEKALAEYFTTDTTIGGYYAEGAAAYNADPSAKTEIEEVNRQVYALIKGDPADEDIKHIYEFGCKASFTYFDKVFAELGVHYEPNGRYLESKSTLFGLAFVKQNTGTVFEESNGAIIYRGEKVGLHTRVFINSLGLPTYEAKDLGLAELKHRDYPNASESIIITANEQTEYFKVMLAALAEIDKQLAASTRHLAHGFLSLTGGKMSSRRGIANDQTAAYLLAAVHDAVKAQYPEMDDETRRAVYLAAVKYSFLRSRIGGDIVFDINESVSLEGNSGPYLQYAHARACSILAKSSQTPALPTTPQFDELERLLVLKLREFSDVLARATADLLPHHICTYLYELSQTFNRFYEKSRVIGDEREALRLALIERYARTLKTGLQALGIPAPERL